MKKGCVSEMLIFWDKKKFPHTTETLFEYLSTMFDSNLIKLLLTQITSIFTGF